MASRLTNGQKQLALRLCASGLAPSATARQAGCTASLVVLMREGSFTSGVADEWSPRLGRLTIGDREEILLGLGRGIELAAMARSLGRPTLTVSREVKANRWTPGVCGPERPPARPRLYEAAEAIQAGTETAAGRGLGRLDPPVVATAGCQATTVGAPGQPGDACVPRNDLPVALRPGPRRS